MNRWLTKYENGGDIKSKKAYIFAEATPRKLEHSSYIIDQDIDELPPELRDIAINYDKVYKKFLDDIGNYNKALDDFYRKNYGNKRNFYNPKITKSILERNKKWMKQMFEYRQAFYNSELNPLKYTTNIDSSFVTEGNKLKQFYDKKGIEASVIPMYGLQDTSKVNELGITPQDDVALFGHSGSKLAGISNNWWNKKFSQIGPDRCLLGSCYGDKLKESFSGTPNLYRTVQDAWLGVNPKADSVEGAMFSTDPETEKTITPQKGVNYDIQNPKFKDGGNIVGAIISTGGIGAAVSQKKKNGGWLSKYE